MSDLKKRLCTAAFALCLAAVPMGQNLLICSAAEEAGTAGEESAAEKETFTSGDYTYSVLVNVDDESIRAACIESYAGSETELVIPETIDDLPVVSLGDRAFSDMIELTAVTLPSQLVGIGEYTFAGCKQLENYYVAEGSGYFESDKGILYAEDHSYLVRYPVGRHPTEFIVPDGVYDIGCSCFADCGTLQSVTLPDSVTQIGAAAFSLCPRLSKINIPEGVDEIEEFTFYTCSSLSSVTLPSSLVVIGNAAFARTGLKSVTLPEKLTSIGEAAFADTPMTEVTIPGSVSEIGYSAFGWVLNAENELVTKDGFVVYGYKGSSAEDYVLDDENGDAIIFKELDYEITSAASDETPAESNTTAETEAAEDDFGTGRLIAIIACGAVLLAVICVTVITVARGKKRKK